MSKIGDFITIILLVVAAFIICIGYPAVKTVNEADLQVSEAIHYQKDIIADRHSVMESDFDELNDKLLNAHYVGKITIERCRLLVSEGKVTTVSEGEITRDTIRQAGGAIELDRDDVIVITVTREVNAYYNRVSKLLTGNPGDKYHVAEVLID